MLQYETHGQGPALFLLHGFLEDRNIWQFLADELTYRYTLVLIDFPGYGNNLSQEFPERLEHLAEALEDLRQSLEIHQYGIVGHSMGVYIGLSWLDVAREQPNCFVAINGNVYADSPERLNERKRSISLLNRHKEAYIKMAIKGLFLPEQSARYSAEITELTNRALQCPKAALTRSIEAMSKRDDQVRSLSRYPGQKHIICGVKDPLFKWSISQEMAQKTGADLHTYQGSHMGWLEAPGLILRVLRTQRIPASSD